MQTDRVTLKWTPYDFDEKQVEPNYNVYRDGVIAKGVHKPFTTIESLQPNTEYAFKVSAADDNWGDLQFSDEIKVKTK
ncbi:fibronectin type III domain-containing protein [Paenibacillus larvae]|uniref:fibronectin type III domain-containing protein n=1 Tax=Paenibacillus larvae TaxID=1464 RepID=UPI00374D1020